MVFVNEFKLSFLSFQLDTAEEVAPNKLRVRAEKCLHCAILTYEIANQVHECSGRKDRSAQQKVTNEVTIVSNTQLTIPKWHETLVVKLTM